MKNAFLDRALNQASDVVTSRNRLLRLSARLFNTLRRVQWKQMDRKSFSDGFYTLGRMSKSYAMGRYRNVPTKAILAIVAAILYFLNPIDLIPDFLPIGLTDDFAVLVWVFRSVKEEVDKYLEWENANTQIPLS